MFFLVAGYMGTQLQYYLHHANTSPKFCPKHSQLQTLWLDFFQTLPPYKYCWYHYIRLSYDPITRMTYSPKGVHVVVPPMGDLKSIEYTSPFPQNVPQSKTIKADKQLKLSSKKLL